MLMKFTAITLVVLVVSIALLALNFQTMKVTVSSGRPTESQSKIILDLLPSEFLTGTTVDRWAFLPGKDRRFVFVIYLNDELLVDQEALADFGSLESHVSLESIQNFKIDVQGSKAIYSSGQYHDLTLWSMLDQEGKPCVLGIRNSLGSKLPAALYSLLD